MWQKMLQIGSGGGKSQIDLLNPSVVQKYTTARQSSEESTAAYVLEDDYSYALAISFVDDKNYDTYCYVKYDGVKQDYTADVVSSNSYNSCVFVAIPDVKSGKKIFMRGRGVLLLYK